MQTVLVTGANRGIGLELARRYAAAGDQILTCCREPGQAAALGALAKSSPNLTLHGVRVSEAASVTALAAEIGDAPLDVLINNAGMAGPPFQKQSLEEMDFDGWAEAFAVNTTRAVTITSQMGAIAFPMPVMYAYCSSKGAVNEVMKMAADALEREGIAVLLVHPGFVKTDMGGPNAEITPEESAAGITSVIANATLASTGKFYKWNGEEHPW